MTLFEVEHIRWTKVVLAVSSEPLIRPFKQFGIWLMNGASAALMSPAVNVGNFSKGV